MAQFTSSGWGAGATVNAYARDAFGNATGAAVGGSPKTASSAGQVTFDPLGDATNYVATDGTRTVAFRTPVASTSGGTPADLSITSRMLTDFSRAGGWLPADSAARPGIAETIPHRTGVANQTIAITGSTLRLVGGIVIPGGRAVNSITFFSGTTALSGGSNQWFCLVDKTSLQVLAVTTDDTTAAWAASSPKTLSFAAPYTPTNAVEAYVGIGINATTTPTLVGASGLTTLFGVAPILAGNSNTGQPTPLTVGATVTALTASGAGIPYAFVA